LVKELVSKATTKTGLEVEVTILDKVYETAPKVSDGCKEQMRIVFDEKWPKWNDTLPPLKVNSG
jgi:hypothetical protein